MTAPSCPSRNAEECDRALCVPLAFVWRGVELLSNVAAGSGGGVSIVTWRGQDEPIESFLRGRGPIECSSDRRTTDEIDPARCYRRFVHFASATITDASFKNNSAGEQGGAVAQTAGRLFIERVAFDDSAATLGGAVMLGASAELHLTFATFRSLSAQNGAIDMYRFASLQPLTPPASPPPWACSPWLTCHFLRVLRTSLRFSSSARASPCAT